MSTFVSTHLMFFGSARQAMSLYQDVFDAFDVKDLQTYGETDGEMAGKVRTARVSFAGHDLMIIDSPPVHDFTFTPAVSLFVDFDDKLGLESAFAALSEDGEVLMPLDDYGFSPEFGWVKDRFGMSWQLNLKPV